MDVVAYERWNETDGDNTGLFAHEMLRHDVYGMPDEDSLVFCPECGEIAEDFGRIDHRSWCFYADYGICPGNF